MVVAVMAGSKPRPGVSSASAPPPHVYPEGGYGWVIVFAYSLNAVLGTQVLAVFGLAFKDVFVELDMPATDIATIMNLNISFSLLIGLFIGALIRKFGYRKVAVSGAVLVSLGTFLTAFSTNLVEFLLSYGITMASGLGLTSPSFNVALNTYFRERRSLAMGLAMASTGVSGILLPQLVSLLVAEYGARGTYVLLSGLALHALVAAALLQPVAWHRPDRRGGAEAGADNAVAAGTAKTARPEEDRAEDDEEDPMLDSEFSLPALPVVREETDADLRQDRERLGLGQEAGFTRRRTSTVSSYHTARGPCDSTLWASASLLDLGCSGSVLALDYAAVPEKTASPVAEEKKPAWHLAEVKANGGSHNLDVEAKDKVDAEAGASPSGPRRRRAAVKRWWLFVVELLDLRLLSSPSMVNLMVAISLAYFAERNFSQFLPFILADRGLSTARIATIMSLESVMETVTKLAAPLVHSALRLSSTVLYSVAIALLVAARTALVLVRGDTPLLLVALSLGAAKGFRSVFYHMVIPDSVPHERLASAIGLQAVINGLFFFALGPFIGYIRDRSGSYDLVIMVCNAFSLVGIVLFLFKFAIKACKARRHPRS